MAGDSDGPAGGPRQAAPPRSRHGSTALFIAAGLVAGAAAAMAVPAFGRPYVTPMYQGMFPPPGWREMDSANENRNAAASSGLLGLCLGGGLGLAAGAARRSAEAAALGLVAGAVTGGAFAAGGGLAASTAYLEIQATALDRTHSAVVVHAVMFGLTGIGVGLGAGIAAGRPARRTAVGAIAGLIAGVAYPVAVILGCPPVIPDHPIPDRTGPLLMWVFAPTAIIAASLSLAAPRSSADAAT